MPLLLGLSRSFYFVLIIQRFRKVKLWTGFLFQNAPISKHRPTSPAALFLIWDRIHGLWTFMLWVFALSWMYVAVGFIRDIPRLWNMHNFYHYLLEIPDRNIQTVSWQLVVSRLMALRDANLSTAQNVLPETRRILQDKSRQRMDAHDIANRLMRRENYLIALFNKEILDVTMPMPFLGKRQFFSRTTEWHVGLSIMDFVFDSRNQINPLFLKEKHRRYLVEQLRHRFFLVGVISILCAPFAVSLFCVSYFFKYFSVSKLPNTPEAQSLLVS